MKGTVMKATLQMESHLKLRLRTRQFLSAGKVHSLLKPTISSVIVLQIIAVLRIIAELYNFKQLLGRLVRDDKDQWFANSFIIQIFVLEINKIFYFGEFRLSIYLPIFYISLHFFRFQEKKIFGQEFCYTYFISFYMIFFYFIFFPYLK